MFIVKGSVPDLVDPPEGCRFHERCPYMMEVCQKEMPVLKETKENHYVACHLY
ncbi:MAG TPA: hypothetical protein DCE14_09465 [Kosmotogaceae bacterium]|nr:hypothetical protein [Kosmotogaceae bacterium]